MRLDQEINDRIADNNYESELRKISDASMYYQRMLDRPSNLTIGIFTGFCNSRPAYGFIRWLNGQFSGNSSGISKSIQNKKWEIVFYWVKRTMGDVFNATQLHVACFSTRFQNDDKTVFDREFNDDLKQLKTYSTNIFNHLLKIGI